ncbi:unnamed protein product [Camellia sinensis]
MGALRYAAQFGSLRYRRCSRKLAVVLFVVFTPGLLFQIPGKNHLVEFGSLNTNGKSIAIHTLLFFMEWVELLIWPQVTSLPYTAVLRKQEGFVLLRFAHTGSHFWGFETQGIVPDIVTMAKRSVILGKLTWAWR